MNFSRLQFHLLLVAINSVKRAELFVTIKVFVRASVAGFAGLGRISVMIAEIQMST